MKKKIKITLHVLFVVGIVITITGRYFDNAKSFNWLVSIIAPDCVSAKRALSDLEENRNILLTYNHKGFEFLIDKWPNLNDKNSVRYIGRGPPFIKAGSTISNDIALIAKDKDQNEIKELWIMSEASAVVDSIINRKLSLVGGFLFWLGIIVSIGSYVTTSITES